MVSLQNRNRSKSQSLNSTAKTLIKKIRVDLISNIHYLVMSNGHTNEWWVKENSVNSHSLSIAGQLSHSIHCMWAVIFYLLQLSCHILSVAAQLSHSIYRSSAVISYLFHGPSVWAPRELAFCNRVILGSYCAKLCNAWILQTTSTTKAILYTSCMCREWLFK